MTYNIRILVNHGVLGHAWSVLHEVLKTKQGRSLFSCCCLFCTITHSGPLQVPMLETKQVDMTHFWEGHWKSTGLCPSKIGRFVLLRFWRIRWTFGGFQVAASWTSLFQFGNACHRCEISDFTTCLVPKTDYTYNGHMTYLKYVASKGPKLYTLQTLHEV